MARKKPSFWLITTWNKYKREREKKNSGGAVMNSCMKLYKQFSDPANALCHNGLNMGKNSPQVSIST